MQETTQSPTHAPPLSPLRRFMRLVRKERKDIITIYITAIMAGLISLSLPLGIQAIFNFVSGGAITTSWVVLVVFVIVGVLANGLLQVFQLAVTERLQQRIFAHSAFEFAYRIPRLQVDSLKGQFAPELVNRFFDTLTIQKGFAKILMDLSGSSLQIIFSLILLSFYHPFFIIFGVILLFLVGIVIRITGPKGLRTSLEESKYKYKVVYWLEEMARTMESFKLAGRTRLPLTRTDDFVSKFLDARRMHFRVLLTEYGIILGLKVIIITGLLVIGSFLVFSNELNVGQFVAMEIVVILLISAIEKLILSIETVYDVLTAVEKIGGVTDLPLESETGTELPLDQGGMSLLVRDVTLQFPDQRMPVLAHLNLKVQAGEHINIVADDDRFVAHFLRLLTGFYSGYAGTVSYNGLPLQDVRLEDLRDKVSGYSTLQEIFEGTLQENITLGIESIPVERVLKLLAAVGLDRFMQEVSMGLNSPIPTGGANLPERIRRKVVLARSLASHPSLLLLNDPFQGLEPADRDSVIAYIQTQLPKATVILMTPEPDTSGLCLQYYTVQDHTIRPIIHPISPAPC